MASTLVATASTGAVLFEVVFRWGDGEAGLAAGHRGQALAVADRFGEILVVHLPHFGFVIVEVDLRRAADHVQIYDVLRLGREVRRRQGRVDPGLAAGLGHVGRVAIQRGQRGGAEGEAGAGEKLPTGFGGEVVGERVHGRVPLFGRDETDASRVGVRWWGRFEHFSKYVRDCENLLVMELHGLGQLLKLSD